MKKKWRLPSSSVFTLGTQPGGEGGCARRRDVVPRGIAAGKAGLPGPHGPAGTEPCRQPGRRRARSLPPVPAVLPRVAAAPPLRPLRRRLRAPQGTPGHRSGRGGRAGQGTALAPFGCLKRSGEQGKCRLTAGKMRGWPISCVKNDDGSSNNSSKSYVHWVFKESP